jgi:hypothetical protein
MRRSEAEAARPLKLPNGLLAAWLRSSGGTILSAARIQIYGTLRLLAEDRENTSATPVFLNNLRLRRADQE